MRIVYKLSAIVLLLSATACGSSRKAAQSPVWVDTAPVEVRQKEKKEVTGSKKKERHEMPRPKMEFTYFESQHVKAAGIHRPLVAEGLEIDMEQLSEEFTYPFRGCMTSDYGPRGRSTHTGVDIKANANDTIRAAMDGVVRMSKSYSGYGNIVVIRHYNGLETVYSHNTRNLVKVNDKVLSGQAIALAGRTGQATGDHLHFEVRAAGEHFDPEKLIDCRRMCLRGGTLYVKNVGGKVVAYNDPCELTAIMENVGNKPVEEVVEAAPVKGKAQGQTAYHTVRKGDTLYSIAGKYGTTVDKLCRLNGISKNGILRLGQKIRYK